MPRRDSPSPLAAVVAARVKQLREERGLTREKLAYENDVSKGYVTDIEKGRQAPSLATLQALADGLGVEVFDLLVDPVKDERHRLVEASRSLAPAAIRKLLAQIAALS